MNKEKDIHRGIFFRLWASVGRSILVCNMKKYIVSGLIAFALLVPMVSMAQSNADIDPNPNESICVSFENNIRYKTRDINTNREVSDLQDFLQEKGYLNFEPTGYFGLMTFAAVMNFQSANGISPTGFVGPITRGKIKEISCGKDTVPTPKNLEPVMCTMDAKMCSDGSYVSRSGPQCAFAACPNTNTTTPRTDARGCYPNRMFSATTGELCNKNLPAGCNSALGFSSTTGLQCGTVYSIPTITFTADPRIIVRGESTMLRWSTTNATSCVGDTQEIEQATIGGSQLIYPNSTTTYTITCSNAIGSTTNKSVTVVVNPQTSTCLSSGYTGKGLRCGCTSNSGWSSTTGLSCNPAREPMISHLQMGGCSSYVGSNTQDGVCNGASSGSTVYVFGSNFNSDSEVYFGDGRQTANTSYISSGSLSFVVPSIPGTWTSVSIKNIIDEERYFSNIATLPLR